MTQDDINRAERTDSTSPLFAGFVGGVLTLWGGMLCLTGIVGGVRAVSLWFGTETTRGTVVGFDTDSDADGTSYVPVVAYHVAGERYKCKGEFGWIWPTPRRGRQVEVVYRAGQPQAGSINTFGQRWLPLLLTTGLGWPAAVVGFRILRGPRKEAVAGSNETKQGAE